jgi:hypothetical protein
MYAAVKIGDNEVRQWDAEKMIDSNCDGEKTSLFSFSSPWKRAVGGNNIT